MKILTSFARFTHFVRSAPALACGVLLLIAPPAFAGPDIQTWTTEKGLRVYFVAAPQLPMLDMRLTFAAGGFGMVSMPGWR